MKPTHQQPSGPAVSEVKRSTLSWRNLRLQTRLIILVLLVSVPLLLISNLILAVRSEQMILSNTYGQLEQTNRALFLKADVWINLNLGILRETAQLPQMVSMDPAQQKIFLESVSKAFPHMYLVHTVNTSGFNVSRSDNQPNRDYKTREYVQDVLAGAPVGYQVVNGLTSNQPALVIGVPIKNALGNVIGVLASASELTVISQDLLQSGQGSMGDQVITYVVDKTDRVIAHPDSSMALKDLKAYPPVEALRGGTTGSYRFTDEQGKQWYAYLKPMDNGWGIITQVERSHAIAPINQFWLVSSGVLFGAVLLLIALSYFLISRSIRPINELTLTVGAVADGDLSRTVPVYSNDEIGQLAHSFNVMTEKLRQLVGDLESRVSERTQIVETSFEISRHLSSILDFRKLLLEVVDQLQKAFNYYHVHIYLLDDDKENLVLMGGTGEAGRLMLAHGHTIAVCRGLVGRSVQKKETILIADTKNEPNWLPNVLLPDTRSEVSVPIMLGNDVIGVLDVQQNVVGGLGERDAKLLESIANQVAAAIQNARVYSKTQSEAEREALLSTLGQKIQQATTIDEVLQITASELGQALGAQRADIELYSPAIALNGANALDGKTGSR